VGPRAGLDMLLKWFSIDSLLSEPSAKCDIKYKIKCSTLHHILNFQQKISEVSDHESEHANTSTDIAIENVNDKRVSTDLKMIIYEDDDVS